MRKKMTSFGVELRANVTFQQVAPKCLWSNRFQYLISSYIFSCYLGRSFLL